MTRVSRRGVVKAAGLGALLFGLGTTGAVAAAPSEPRLPPGFGRTFSSSHVMANGLRQHVVVGGEGPPLLLVHGWPQTWYAWRDVMPELAKRFRVIAVDQRGMGRTGKPHTGYDTGTLATDLIALMDVLGHNRFAVVGHDTGLAIGYALASDHPDRVARLAVAEAVLPGLSETPPVLTTPQANERLWHLMFNRLAPEVNEALVRGREEVYFGPKLRPLPDHAVEYYLSVLRDPDALRGSFGWYRALDVTIPQNAKRAQTKLTQPVLAIGGARGLGDGVAKALSTGATNVRAAVIPGCGHWVAEEAPAALLAVLTGFLAPYQSEDR